MPRSVTTAFLACVAGLAFSAAVYGQPQYSVKQLGPLAGDGGSSATAINNHEQVAGWSISQSAETPYRWSDGFMEALPVTGSGTSNFAFGISDSGSVVGRASFPGAASNAALWSRDDDGDWSVEDLGNLPGFAFSQANDLANSGELAVGDVDDAFEQLIATAWEYDPDASPPWRILSLGALAGYYGSYANGVNDQGVAVGASYIPYQTVRATRWTRTHAGWSAEALPFLPGGFDHSVASAVNEHGVTTGWAIASDGLRHAVIWLDSGIVDLGAYPGEHTYGLAINDDDQVVGETRGFGLERAFLAHNGQIVDLNDLIPPDTGWTLRSATGINNQGQIVGEGAIGGFRHSFLLTPVAMTLEGPEPGIVSVPNTFTISAGDDEEVYLYYSFSAGETPIAGCTAVPLNLGEPGLLAVFPGATSITIELPDGFSGETVYFQAASSSKCAVSNVVRHTFP